MKVYVGKIKNNRTDTAYELLRSALRNEYGSDMPNIVKDGYGKPYFSEEIGIYFSISHSGSFVMCAVDTSPVGADIQIIKDVSEHMKNRLCSKTELECVDFISLWCMKESFIKFKGYLDRPYKDIVFTPDEKVFHGPENTFAKLLTAPEGYRAAVCGPVENEHSAIMCVNCY